MIAGQRRGYIAVAVASRIVAEDVRPAIRAGRGVAAFAGQRSGRFRRTA